MGGFGLTLTHSKVRFKILFWSQCSKPRIKKDHIFFSPLYYYSIHLLNSSLHIWVFCKNRFFIQKFTFVYCLHWIGSNTFYKFEINLSILPTSLNPMSSKISFCFHTYIIWHVLPNTMLCKQTLHLYLTAH